MEDNLKQRIIIWKTLHTNDIDETDKFISDLITEISRLEEENEELGYTLKEFGESW